MKNNKQVESELKLCLKKLQRISDLGDSAKDSDLNEFKLIKMRLERIKKDSFRLLNPTNRVDNFKPCHTGIKRY